VDDKLCADNGKISLVGSDSAPDIECAGADGCDADTCCSDYTCKLYFDANPSDATGFCDPKKFVDTEKEGSCTSTTKCTATECCTDNPTCSEASFAESECTTNDAKTHLGNPTEICVRFFFFRQRFTLEDAIGSHTFAPLEALPGA
jgi:hypothetical protein